MSKAMDRLVSIGASQSDVNAKSSPRPNAWYLQSTGAVMIVSGGVPSFLLEDGGLLLLETGDRLILE